MPSSRQAACRLSPSVECCDCLLCSTPATRSCLLSLAHCNLPALPTRPPPSQIDRTHIPRARDGESHPKYGFVHFRERSSAVRAVEDLEKPQLDGALLNVRGIVACCWPKLCVLSRCCARLADHAPFLAWSGGWQPETVPRFARLPCRCATAAPMPTSSRARAAAAAAAAAGTATAVAAAAWAAATMALAQPAWREALRAWAALVAWLAWAAWAAWAS